MKIKKINALCFTALFTALIFLCTTFLGISVGNGYVHVGDAMNYLASVILPFPYGIISGAVGGALSDIVKGYTIYALPTFIIKGFNASCFYIIRSHNKTLITSKSILACALSSLITIFGYWLTDVFLYGFAGSLVSVIGNLVQVASSFVIFVIVGYQLDKKHIAEKIYKQLY